MFNIDEQRLALSKLPDKRFIQTSNQVKGPYTSGGYVIYMLNTILGPDNWRHTITKGPEIIRLSDTQAYVQVTVRLDVQFANGNQVTHEDVGVWPLAATNAKEGGTLDDTAPERYETVLKACVTDAIKACAEYLGVCFRPLADKALAAALNGTPVTGAAPLASSTSGSNGAPGKAPAPQAAAPAHPAAPAPTPPASAPAPAPASTPASKPLVPAGAVRKQASIKCALKAFDEQCLRLAKYFPRYRLVDGKPDKAHVLYTLYSIGFPILTDANLEPAFEVAFQRAAAVDDENAADRGPAVADEDIPF